MSNKNKTKSSNKSRQLKIEEHVEFKKLKDSNDPHAIAIWNLFTETRNEDDFNRSVIEILTNSKNTNITVNSPIVDTKDTKSKPNTTTNNNSNNKEKLNDFTPSNKRNSKHAGDETKTKSSSDEKKANITNKDKVIKKKGKESTEKEKRTVSDSTLIKESNTESNTSLNTLTDLLKSTIISPPSPSLCIEVIQETKNNDNLTNSSHMRSMSFGLWNGADNIDKKLSNILVDSGNNVSDLSDNKCLGFSFDNVGRSNHESFNNPLFESEKSINHWDVAQELLGKITNKHSGPIIDNDFDHFSNNSMTLSHSNHGFPINQHQSPLGFQHRALGNPMFFPPGGFGQQRLSPPNATLHNPFGTPAHFPPVQPVQPLMFSTNFSHFQLMHPGTVSGNPAKVNLQNLSHGPVNNHDDQISVNVISERQKDHTVYVDEKVINEKMNDSVIVVVNEKSIAAHEISSSAVPSKIPLFRTTRNQCSRLSISINQQSRRDNHVMCTENNNSVRPGWHMMVHWEMPLKELYKEDSDYVIALLRFGSPTNSTCIVTKKIEINGRSTIMGVDNQGNEVVRGKVPFHAPKSAGVFVYRIFDQSSKERSFVTLGMSIAFNVDLQDLDVSTSLKFCIDLFLEKSHQRAICQLRTTVNGIRNSGRVINGESANNMLSKCVDYMIEVTIQAMQSFEVAKAEVNNDKNIIECKENGEEKNKDDDIWVHIKQAGKLQKDIYDTFCSIRYNDIAWTMLPELYQLKILRTQELYCPLLYRYFFTPQARDECRRSEFNFIPSPCSSRNQLQEKLSLAALEKTISDILPSLLPSPDFHIRRENARMRVQKAICSSSVVPENTEFVLYGSSRNNFGTDSADLDMCMIFPPNMNIAVIDRPALIVRLADVLTKIGMIEVSARATARIPIVQFKDPQTGFDCDISFNNPLAVANTKLLKIYSEIDSRVLPLAFIIKHWVKSRLINSPGDGTLSSYGYIICLIHFLQHRPIPLLPKLQQIPPDWDGNPNFRFGNYNSNWHRTIESHPVDGTSCDTYFYNPPKEKVQYLKNFAARNKETTAELLAGFFQYFAWEFNYRHNVVHIKNMDPIDKLTKAETDCWNQHDRISIEDPFETWYDVAHVVKSPQMFNVRKEFLRAHTLIARCANHGPFDSLPSSVDPQALLGKICECCDEREKPPTPHQKEENDNEDDLTDL